MKYKILGNYYDNEFHISRLKGPDAPNVFIKKTCPANTDEILWELPVNFLDLDKVVASSMEGFHHWKKTSIDQRIQFLKRYQEEVLAIKDQVAEAISLESGKPLWEAKTEVASVIGKVDVTINDSLPRVAPQSFTEILPKNDAKLIYKPLGPCLIIGPFNFPCHLANTQILSALLSGNSVIFKPSEKVAYSGQLLIECFHRAGFPKGVINLIQGGGELSSRLVKERKIKAVFFTGSKEIGINILKNTYSHLDKLVSMELGGKNTAIVHKDAPYEFTVKELIKGSFLTTGQRCTSTSMVIIHQDILDRFVDDFHGLSKKVIIDHPIQFEQEPLMGPLIDQKALDNYLLYMGMAKREGIEEIMRGKQIEKRFPGYYVSPSIHVAKKFDSNSHFLGSEIFGPNCTFIPYQDIEEAIEIANSTEYGLASCLFSTDESLFEKCTQNIDVGLFNINRSTCGASPKLPFGGVKSSGNYRPAAVATIDASVYVQASLENKNVEVPDKILGVED